MTRVLYRGNNAHLTCTHLLLGSIIRKVASIVVALFVAIKKFPWLGLTYRVPCVLLLWPSVPMATCPHVPVSLHMSPCPHVIAKCPHGHMSLCPHVPCPMSPCPHVMAKCHKSRCPHVPLSPCPHVMATCPHGHISCTPGVHISRCPHVPVSPRPHVPTAADIPPFILFYLGSPHVPQQVTPYSSRVTIVRRTISLMQSSAEDLATK